MPSSPSADGASRRCVLAGPPGVGKSAVGRAAAASLGWTFVDLDEAIEAEAGVTVARIFERDGEAAFRGRERAMLLRALDGERVVVAAGGGALADRAVRHVVLRRSRVVALSAPVEALRERIAEGAERPLLRGGEGALLALLGAREDAYAEAHATLDATGALGDIAASVAALARSPMPMVAPLGRRTYRAYVEPLGGLARQTAAQSFVAMVTDEAVWPRWGAAAARLIGGSLATVVLPSSRRSRTMRSVSRVWEAAGATGARPRGSIVCVGGGAVLDVGGFAAATWLRGVPYVSVPTSLLAMVGASVDGSSSLDLPGGRGLVGARHPPSLVWIDPAVLSTLPPRHFRAALAEVVRVAAERDATLLGWLEDNAAALGRGAADGALEAGGLIDVMLRRVLQARIDAAVDDAPEPGARPSAGFGHIVGRALEVGSEYRALRGDCLAAGMRAELEVGHALGVTSTELRRRVLAVMDALGLARSIRADGAVVRPALRREKEHPDGHLGAAPLGGTGAVALASAPSRVLSRALSRVIEIR